MGSSAPLLALPVFAFSCLGWSSQIFVECPINPAHQPPILTPTPAQGWGPLSACSSPGVGRRPLIALSLLLSTSVLISSETHGLILVVPAWGQHFSKRVTVDLLHQSHLKSWKNLQVWGLLKTHWIRSAEREAGNPDSNRVPGRFLCSLKFWKPAPGSPESNDRDS